VTSHTGIAADRLLARNIAEVIDDLHRQHAPPRDHERMIELVQHQIEHVMRMAVKEERRRRDLVDPAPPQRTTTEGA
jgi:hypothetical protein